jgi:nucleotide-binding universal stress UspA family protein
MVTNMLVFMDETDARFKGIQYLRNRIQPTDEVKITLLAVLDFTLNPEAARFETSRVQPKKRRSKWRDLEREFVMMKGVFEKANTILTEAGVKPENIAIKYRPKENGVVPDILAEIEEGGYDTIVIGHKCLSKSRQFLTGSICKGLISRVSSACIWIVP